MDAMLVELMDLFLQTATNKGHLKNDSKQYVLKVVGREEYLIGDYRLTQFNVSTSSVSYSLLHLWGTRRGDRISRALVSRVRDCGFIPWSSQTNDV